MNVEKSSFSVPQPPQPDNNQVRLQQLIAKNFETAQSLKCENCDNTTFHQAVGLKRISKLVLGTQADAVIPYQVHVCTKCGETLELQ